MSAQPVSRFSTPSEFLEHIRSAYMTHRMHAEPDLELLRITEEDLDALGLSRPDPTNPYDSIIRELGGRVADSFRARYDFDLRESCAIGALEDEAVNARCFRSDEGHYAVVLHHGLMNILHKRSKLLTAAVDPSSVIYCNRKDVSQLTSRDLVSWAEELGDIYLAVGETKGALVKFKKEAASAAAAVLTLSEAFVLGHEIGHVVAGHLADDSRLVPDDKIPWLQFFPESRLHEEELKADGYGFRAMSDTLGSVSKTVLLGALVSTFSTFSIVGAGAASDSHPSARDRIHRIVERHFSVATARLVRRWVDDGDQHAAAEALTTAS